MAVRRERGALVGALVYGVAGAAWSLWGSGGLPGPLSVVVAVVGVLAGAVVVVTAALGLRHAQREAAPMTGSRAYRLTTLAECAAIAAGAVVLALLGLQAFFIAWTALVVGGHFLVFGRLFDPRFRVVGALLVGAAVLGTVVGLVSGSPAATAAVCGLLSATVLLAAGGLVFASGTPEA